MVHVFRKLVKQHRCNQIVRVGERLRQLQQKRTELLADGVFIDDLWAIDDRIDYLERRLNQLRDLIKEST